MRSKVFEFGPFQLDPAQQQLSRRGTRLKLPPSRLRLLLLFLTRHGDLLTREEIAACLWSDAQNVDIMSGINTAVNQLRAHLGDDPASPKYIETVIGAGYRFIASVSEGEAPGNPGVEIPQEPEAATTVEGSSAPEAASVSAAGGVNRKRMTTIAMAAAVVLCILFIFYLIQGSAFRGSVPQADFGMARVTDSGDIQFADISPDGNYLVYVRNASGLQSLLLKQLTSGRVLELATMGEDECPGLAFSPDGNYVYFVRRKPLQPGGELYRVPFLGGTPTMLMSGVSGAPAISPDGRRVAFVRSTLSTHGQDSIVIASVDGSDERVLALYDAPGIPFNRITWTADGKSLVYPLQSNLMAIPAEGGTAHPLPGEKWAEIDDVRQLPQSNDLILVGQLPGSASPQIFEISLVGGKARPITHDLSGYTEVRPTADGKALLALQRLILSSIQVLKRGNGTEPRTLHDENQNRDGFDGLAWTPQGNIVYLTEPDGRGQLMQVDDDGSNSRRLAGSDPPEAFSDPAVSPRGDFIAIVKWRNNDGANIWRMDMDGSNEKSLTNGTQDFPPSVTPDGQWVVYGSVQGDRSVLMKVPSHGGPATRLTDYNADLPAVSPDGKWIACYRRSQQNQPTNLTIIPLDGGPPAKVFQLPVTAIPLPPAWTPDGRAVGFISSVNGVGNLWQQPVAGGSAVPVTHFTSGKIFNFKWSRDGKLALSRGTETVDAILIKNFRQIGQ
jgi:eukaryotic-like serine/threonine-protein kinase